MSSKLTTIMLLTGAVIITPVAVMAETAVEAVESFYQAATTEGMCKKAILIRPGYSLDQCRQFKKVKIKSLALVKETETEAIVRLKMKYETNKNLRFNGYLHLYKKAEQWHIIGSDYRSRKSMSQSQYIKTFLGTAKQAEEKEDINAVETDTLSGSHRKVLIRLEKKYPKYAKKFPIVLIDVSEQEMYLYEKKLLKRIYPISTAVKGEGSESEQTPLGVHVVRSKFGKDAPFGTIFVNRKSTGRIAEIIRDTKDMPESFVTSRGLWLGGLETGKNKGEKVDTYNRHIYIQGTDEEGLIGRKASHGSIRMYNKDIIKAFDKLSVGSLVYIGR